MGIYDVSVNGYDVKVRVVDDDSVVELGLSELRHQFINPIPKVVAVDARYSSRIGKTALMLLCVGRNCLVLQLQRLSSIPNCLKEFLACSDYSFVSTKQSTSIALKRDYGLEIKHCVDVAQLAARILQRPDLLGVAGNDLSRRSPMPLRTVANAAGYSYHHDEESIEPAHQVFSQEQIKCLVPEVHMVCVVGESLLSSLK